METADIISIIEAAGVPAFDGSAFASKRQSGAYVYLYPAAYTEIGPGGSCEIVEWMFKITIVGGDEATVRGYADSIRAAFLNPTTSGLLHTDRESPVYRQKSLWVIEITGRNREWLT